INKFEEYDYGYLKPTSFESDQETWFNPMTSLADNDGDSWFDNNNLLSKSDKMWLFDQGFREIDGVSRGLYLEELYNNMVVVNGSTGTGSDETTMPIALIKSKDANNYNIYLDNIEVTPTGGKL